MYVVLQQPIVHEPAIVHVDERRVGDGRVEQPAEHVLHLAGPAEEEARGGGEQLEAHLLARLFTAGGTRSGEQTRSERAQGVRHGGSGERGRDTVERRRRV